MRAKTQPRRQAKARKQARSGPRKNQRRRPKTAPQPAVAAVSRVREETDGPTWPRRLLRVGLRLGTVLAVVWGLLLGAREVYEYATTAERFEARHLIFEPSEHVSDEQLRGLLELEPGTNILALDLEHLQSRVEADPWVAHATVLRELPDTLLVEVEEHDPAAVLLAGRFYLVNAQGEPFKRVQRGERGELPVITGIPKHDLLEDPDGTRKRLREALALIEVYEAKQRPRLGEIHLDDDGTSTLYTEKSGTQLRLGHGDPAAGLARYDALRAVLGDRAERLSVVHLESGTPKVAGQPIGPESPEQAWEAIRRRPRERIVARFFSERDEKVLLAEAAAAAERDEPAAELKDHARHEEKTKKSEPKKKRIPRYE